MGKHHGQNNIVPGWGRGQFVRLAVSNYAIDIGKQAALSQEFCPRLQLHESCHTIHTVSKEFEAKIVN